MSAIAGLRGTGDWGTDERPKDFREKILWYAPNGSAPIFALSAKARKMSVTDPEFAWWNESMTIVRLKNSGALGAADTLVTVDSADPTSTTMTANYGTAQHLKPGDVLLAEPATDNATFNQEMLKVENVISDTQFTVERGFGGTTPGTIADDIMLLKIGSAYAEGTSAPRATTRNPIKFKNYTQIFKDSYELTKTADKTKARTGDPWSNDKKRKMFDHSAGIEHAILFGRQFEGTGSNGKPLRLMGGVREFIPSTNVTVFDTAVTPELFLDAVAPLFDWDTGAGDTRVMFMGRQAVINMAKVLKGAMTVMTEPGNIKVYGMDFKEWTLPMGRLLVKVHPLLSRNTLYTKSAFIIDFDALKYVYLDGRDTKVHDDVQADDEDVRRGYVQTECSLQVDYGGLTMGYLGNIRHSTT